jgi:hypothetical protein
MAMNNLKSASNEKEMLAAMIPIKLLIANYEMTLGQPRNQLQALIPKIFPFLENYAMKFMKEMTSGNSNEAQIVILTKIMKCFLMCNYMTCEPYFAGEKLQIFLFIAKSIMDSPLASGEG